MKKKGDRISFTDDFAEPLSMDFSAVQSYGKPLNRPTLTISKDIGGLLTRKLRIASSELKSKKPITKPIEESFERPRMPITNTQQRTVANTTAPPSIPRAEPKPQTAQLYRSLPPLPPPPTKNRLSVVSPVFSDKRQSYMSSASSTPDLVSCSTEEEAEGDESAGSLYSYYRDDSSLQSNEGRALPPLPTKRFSQQEVRNYDFEEVRVVDVGMPPQVPRHLNLDSTNDEYIRTRTEVTRKPKPVEQLDTAIFTRKSVRVPKSYGPIPRANSSIANTEKPRTASEDYLASHGLIPFMLSGYQDHGSLKVVNRVSSSTSTLR
ncbi:unnamed protein product [Kuraishia capsulata CBS 1993]|uniref:Uncharacterized protein n=1 Tax=Kuraishia capsulata CBS 1993 TaxID=1382522 RepID=W6MG65_9ASCO|nr:uncharacterized protein KUCA_T00000702001 [Kuraishia capsulata CBS 1993]CDK24736.1 unnamed protein product [Kuraishia capsulata CBS 1993]